MKNKLHLSLFIFISTVLLVSCNKQKHTLKLWYQQPARDWLEALPVGNGRMGAMVFGGTGRETIQLNEESLWAGAPVNNNNPNALKWLPKIRQLLLENKIEEANKLSQRYLLGTPPHIRSYQTLGELNLTFSHIGEAKNYRRELNLETGIATSNYECNGVKYEQQVFASSPDNVIVYHLTSSHGKISTSISLNRIRDAETEAKGKSLIMQGQVKDLQDSSRGPLGNHMKFAAIAEVIINKGEVTPSGDSLLVKNATDLTILITAKTDYSLQKLDFDRSINPLVICEDILNKAKANDYKNLRKKHIADHQALFNRVDFRICNEIIDSIPTDIRLQHVIAGQPDHHLEELYFQYGRYLLMGSSRAPGILPANLQGVWNKEISAPWESDYHVNINLQMNYWLADVCNLPETTEPLTNFFERIMVPGKVTAHEMYNCKGWTMHHVTDPFGRTGLMDGIQWGTFPMGGSWMSLHFWEHYQFTQDREYLEKKAWPILKGSSKFVMDFLFMDKDSFLVTAPSYSPENSYFLPGTKTPMQLTYGATMDIEIARELLKDCIIAANILKESPAFIDSLENTISKLPPIRISKYGTIMEWIKDYDEVEPGHRHISQLFALHPGSQITERTPELMNAARKTIERRLSNGGGHTGWSRAWIINFYARLKDSDSAYNHFQKLLGKSTLTNLFDTHPPFQIDGNFGGTAGIAEMLLQSHTGAIDILPALPKQWQNGYIRGLKARGNVLVDILWKNGKLEKLSVKPNTPGIYRIHYGNDAISVDMTAGRTYEFDTRLRHL